MFLKILTPRESLREHKAAIGLRKLGVIRKGECGFSSGDRHRFIPIGFPDDNAQSEKARDRSPEVVDRGRIRVEIDRAPENAYRNCCVGITKLARLGCTLPFDSIVRLGIVTAFTEFGSLNAISG